MDLWTYGHIAGAKEAALALADWVCDRVLSWDKETRKKVLSVEYGGMNDSLYQLYTLTGDKRYLSAAEVFDEPELYEELLSFKNRMRGVHANATIPKILGYLEGAMAFDKAGIKEEVQPRITTAEKFWDAVIRNQTYATGGIGDMEHFFADGLLDGSRTQCNAESCCCYNMMKLSQLLFELTPSEPSANPFWCCVGTALEDFASIGGKICYRKDPDLYITQWISSDIRFGEQVYQLRADYGKGRLTISCAQCDAGTTRVKLRIPRWIKNRDLILPDSEEFLDVAFPPDGTFELGFEMQLKITGLPDEASAKGFMYGPFVLCVPLGNDKWGITENAGIEVVAPAWKVVFDASVKCNINYGKTQRAVLDREYLTLPEGVALQAFSDNLEKYLAKDNDRFLLTGLKDFRGGDISLPLIPYYQAGNERYGIYWYIRSNQDLA